MVSDERARGGPSAAARRETLGALAEALGERAVVEGDRVIVDVGEPVALYAQVEPSGEIVLTWWMTASTAVAHHRWREAAATILGPGEAIHTSGLGGGYLVEVERRARSVAEAAALAGAAEPAERVRALVAAYPEAVAALPPEPAPDYLRPPE
ncbi:MAG: hypothetical protein IRY97_08025, partial [Thermomicrobiaceae bacterium]|nr:hypothetical protein [Thermomicrobiaceae bacterium]